MKKIAALFITIFSFNTFASIADKTVQFLVVENTENTNESLESDFNASSSGLRYVISHDQLEKLIGEGTVEAVSSKSGSDCIGGGTGGGLKTR
jgi:hypothetical protein